ncbi:MAG TPA: MFS transporter [Bryobacteraceae bacterium]|nr:MFS transporter [Bryobacteraceae bacterium]
MRLRAGNALLVLLTISVAINYLDRGALSVAAPLITREMNLSPTQMGLLFSAFFWSYSSFQLLAGWMVDRYPVRWVYAVGFLMWSLATAAVGLVSGLLGLFAARLVLGMGESVAYPASSKIIVRHFPEERRGFANALVDAGAKLGPGLSTLLGGLTVDAFGWRAMFLFAGLAGLLWLVPWLLITRSSERAECGVTVMAGPGWSEMLHCRQVWGTSVGMFSLGYVLYFLLSWLPSYLVSERGFSMGSMAVLGSIPFWGMALSSLFGGWTSDRWIRGGADPGKVRKLYAASGLLLCAGAMVPAPLVSSSGTSVALITAACVFLGLFTSNVWAITQTLAGPLASGRWTGVQNAIGNLGGVVSPLLTGWLVSETGSFSLAFTAATVVLVGGAVVYLMSLGNVRPVTWMSSSATTPAAA